MAVQRTRGNMPESIEGLVMGLVCQIKVGDLTTVVAIVVEILEQENMIMTKMKDLKIAPLDLVHSPPRVRKKVVAVCPTNPKEEAMVCLLRRQSLLIITTAVIVVTIVEIEHIIRIKVGSGIL